MPPREFVENSYVELKKANPQLPILVRECSGVQPRLWARFGKFNSSYRNISKYITVYIYISCSLEAMGKETSVSLTNVSSADVKKQIEDLGQKH